MFSAPLSIPDATPECDADRRARQLAMLRRLSEIGMELAELARRDALREAEEVNAAMPPEPRRRDPKVLFARLASGVRQAIAMERRIAAGELFPVVANGVMDVAKHPETVIAKVTATVEAAAARLGVATGRSGLMGSAAGLRIEGLERASVPMPLFPPRKPP